MWNTLQLIAAIVGAIAFIGSIFYSRVQLKNDYRNRLVTRIVTGALLLAMGVLSVFGGNNLAIMLGMIWAALGDILLAMCDNTIQKGQLHVGLLKWGVICFIWQYVFVSLRLISVLFNLYSILVTLALVLIMLTIWSLSKVKVRGIAVHAVVYSAALSFMTASAVMLTLLVGGAANTLLLIGTALAYISGLMLLPSYLNPEKSKLSMLLRAPVHMLGCVLIIGACMI